ncbi:MAG: PD-(D/E)XK nuclease family protein [Phycisphaerales bacterium]
MSGAQANAQSDPEGDPAADLAALERFVLENDDLLELEERIGRFNIFDALGIARRELQHSNFLAWLLDPAESHGQGDLFLRALLVDLMREAGALCSGPIGVVEVAVSELRGAQVRREWPSRTDLTISLREPPLVLAIENKVDSGEHSGQLARYATAVRSAFPDHTRLLVYLTREGDSPSDESWVAYSYASLHAVLKRTRERAGATLGGAVGVLVDQYINLVGSRFMVDPKIEELCRAVFAKHKRAIELIWEFSGGGEGPIANAIAERIRSVVPTVDVVAETGREIRVLPKGWKAALPDIGFGDLGRTWLLIRVRVKGGQASISLRTLLVKDELHRNAVLASLFAPDSGLGLKPAFKNWTGQRRVMLWRERVASWTEDEEPDVAAIAEKAVKRLEAALARWSDIPAIVESASAAYLRDVY